MNEMELKDIRGAFEYGIDRILRPVRCHFATHTNIRSQRKRKNVCKVCAGPNDMRVVCQILSTMDQ